MLGFLYLCALPSTVSSSVAMTALARGNVAASVFNATLSMLIGVFMTPLLVRVLLGYSGGTLALGATMMDIARLLLLPFGIGQLLRPVAGAWFAPLEAMDERRGSQRHPAARVRRLQRFGGRRAVDAARGRPVADDARRRRRRSWRWCSG